MSAEIVPRDITIDGTAMTELGLMDVVLSSFNFPFDDGLLKNTEISIMSPLATPCPRCMSEDIDGLVFETNHGAIIACKTCNKFVKMNEEEE